MRMKKSKLFALILALLLIVQSVGVVSFAVTDLAGHWSATKVNEWIGLGYISGYPDGTFKPDAKITRAEFMTIVNKSFGFNGSTAISFKDVKSADWYYGTIATAVYNGYIGGYPDGSMKPNAPISRAEAAVIITKITQLTADATTAGYYNDKTLIPSWSLGAVGAVTKAGIMSGYAGNIFGAQRSITRAETVTALSKALLARAASSQTYNKAGTYGPSTGTQFIAGDVKITAASVNLRNMIVTGNLTVDQSVGSGNVSLSNVVIQGAVYVNGGGVNSVAMENVKASTLYAARKEGMVRIVATGSTRFDTTFIQGDTRLEETALTGGGFEDVYVNSDAGSTVDLDFVGVKLDVLNLKARNTKTTFDNKSTVIKLTVTGTGNIITTVSGTTISTLVADAAVEVLGAGTISKAEVNVSGVSFDIMPTSLTVKSGVSQPTITGSGIAWTPVKGATAVEIDSNIVIKFTETVRLSSGNTALTNSNVDDLINLRTKTSSGTKVAFDATVATSSGKTIITINPSNDLSLNQIYYVSIDLDSMEDTDNNDIVGDSSITFTTIADGVPTVQSFDPLNSATNVSVDGNLKITFSEKVRLISSNTDLTNSNVDNVIILKKTNSSGSSVGFDATVSTVSSKTVITINPDSNLLANQVYYIAVKDDVLEDYSDLKLAGTKSATFTTVITTAVPQVETYSPANGASNINADSNLTITLNKEVRLVNNTALTNTNVDAQVVLKETNSSGTAFAFDATVTTTNSKTVITVNPTGTLKSNQVYYLAIDGLEDYIDQALTGTKAITFTTLASGAPMLESFSPITNGALDTNVVMTFSKEIRAIDNTVLSTNNVVSKLGVVFKKDNASGADIAFTPSLAVANNKTVITLDPTPSLAGGTTYYVAFDNVEDTSNQVLIGSKSFSFTTIPVLVTSITVVGKDGVNTITADDGTLTMQETVLPTNATNQLVTWSVRNSGDGTASINSSTGVLKALTNGVVYVKATSVSTPTIVSPEVMITLSNQTVQASGLSPVVSVASPLEWEKVLLTVSTAPQTGHKIYYHFSNSNPSAMAVGSVVDPSSWTEITDRTAVKISAVDGKYIEVIELSGTNAVTKWGKTGLTDDGVKEITSAKAIADVVVQKDTQSVEEIKAVLGANVILKSGTTEVSVPVTWETSTYDKTSIGTYVFTGTIGTLPTGYVDMTDTITSVTVTIKVEALTLLNISIKTYPTKMSYTVGESLVTAGIVVEGVYNFGANQNVTESVAFTGFDSSVAGSSIVIVTLNGKTTSFTVTIDPLVIPSP